MTPGPKSQAGGIVSSGTLNKNSYCLVSRNDRPYKKYMQKNLKKLCMECDTPDQYDQGREQNHRAYHQTLMSGECTKLCG